MQALSAPPRISRYILSLTYKNGDQRSILCDYPDAEEQMRNHGAVKATIETIQGKHVSTFTIEQLRGE